MYTQYTFLEILPIAEKSNKNILNQVCLFRHLYNYHKETNMYLASHTG